jgi:hypothetical protein
MLVTTPGVVARDDIPGRLAYRLIDRAAECGWNDDHVAVLLELGQRATRGLGWKADDATNRALCRYRRKRNDLRVPDPACGPMVDHGRRFAASGHQTRSIPITSGSPVCTPRMSVRAFPQGHNGGHC